MEVLTADLVKDYLGWLETERECGRSTRNQRLAAIHSFFRYAQAEEPEGLMNFQKVLAIPVKKNAQQLVEHLTPNAMKLLLDQPDRQCRKGRRNLTLMSVLYDTGARVQELIDLRVRDIVLTTPALVILTGKGNKSRRVPLMSDTASLVQAYMVENQLHVPAKDQHPLFFNSRRERLTKEGVAYIIAKYVALARERSSLIPIKVNPHMFRHSKAMHLLQADVPRIYIRDFLGHVDEKTTEIYAKTDTETKRKAIENLYPGIIDSTLPDWSQDEALLTWLAKI